MGQGERAFYLGNGGNRSRFSSPDAEHTVAGKQMLLVGDSATRMQVWDAIRSLDVLASHPLVDSKRLASTGQSGGGTSTMFLCAADERLAAAVVCGGNTENFALADFNPPGSTDDGEQNFPGAGPLGWDRWDLLHPFAGKPLLITVSDKDYFGTYSPRYIDNGWAEFAKLKKMYGVLGASERLAWGGTALPHGLGYDTRLQVYSWLSRWLRGDARPVTEEPPGEPEPEATLFATASGSVVRSLGSETPFSLTRARTIARTPLDLAALLAIDRPPAINTALVLRSMPIGTAEVSAVEIPSAPGVSLPAWRYRPPRGTAVRGCIVLLQNAGRLTNWHQGGLFHELALAGHVVLVPDVRGSGDLTGELPRGSARHARDHDSEDAWAWASLVLGKPLLGQRVTDVLATLAAARHEHRRVWLCAQGKMTVPAQIAAALDPRVAGVYLAGGLVSFRSVVDTEAYQHAFANFVPGILVHTDLPEITRGIAPRPVVLAGAVDGAGNTMKPEVVRTLYGDAEHIQILPDAKWDAARIGEVAKPTA
jgi:dienelactone hydrolase